MTDISTIKARIEAAKPSTFTVLYKDGSSELNFGTDIILSVAEAQALVEELERLKERVWELDGIITEMQHQI